MNRAAPTFCRALSAACAGLALISALVTPARAERWTTTLETQHSSQPEFLPIALATTIPVSHADRHFMEKALQVVRDEMRLSHLAVDRGTDARLKDFAQRVYSSQADAEKTLTVLAASKGLSTRNEERSDRYFTALNEKEGADFDLYFVAHLIDVEDDTITLFEKSARSDDPEIAACASRVLTTLQAHIREAKDLERALRRER